MFLAASLLFPHSALAFKEFTIRDEIELGRKFNIFIQSRYTLITDPVIVSYVRDLVQRIARFMPAQPYPLTISVLDLGGLNAFATPGGYVYVHSGLILNLEHESELAGVVAHELAHVSQRHIARNISRSQYVSLAALLGVMAGAFLGGDAGAALTVGSLAGSQSLLLKYSRENEDEADQVGIQYLVRAGFPPQGMTGAFRKIRRLQWLGGGSLPTYLSTHPGVEDRISDMQDRIDRLPSEVQHLPERDKEFKRIQTLLRAKYTDPETALSHFGSGDAGDSCLKSFGLAMVLDRMNRNTQAAQEYESGLACIDDDPLWLREAGRFYFQKGDFNRAIQLLQMAAFKSPRDHVTLFYYARVQAGLGDAAGATQTLERALKYAPQDPEVHYHLGRLLGEQGRLFAAHVHLSYAALYHNQDKQARFHLQRAASLSQDPSQKAMYDKLHAVYTERKEFWDKLKDQ